MIKKMKRYMTHAYVTIMDLMHFPLFKRGSEDPYHKVFVDFMSLTDQADSPAILEIGSRNVRDITRRNLFPNCEDYVGFDILAGDGVDAVGDVHKLAETFRLSVSTLSIQCLSSNTCCSRGRRFWR